MAIDEYRRPLCELYLLAQLREEWETNPSNYRLRVFMEVNLPYVASESPRCTATHVSDLSSWTERVKALWEEYKQSRFDSVLPEDLEVLKRHCRDIDTDDADIFLHLFSQNHEICAFQMALDVNPIPVLLVTNADRMRTANWGGRVADIDISECGSVVYYRSRFFYPDPFFPSTVSIDNDSRKHHFVTLLYQSNHGERKTDFMVVSSSGESGMCHLQIEGGPFPSCDIARKQMPSINADFYEAVWHAIGRTDKALRQTMSWAHVGYESLPVDDDDETYAYYCPECQDIIPVSAECIRENLRNKICLLLDDTLLDNGVEVSGYMKIYDRPCYILDSRTIRYYDGKGGKLLIEEDFEPYDVFLLFPGEAELAADPAFISGVNRFVNTVATRCRAEGFKPSPAEIAFIMSCADLDDEERLLIRVRKALEENVRDEVLPPSDEREPLARRVTADLVDLRSRNLLTADFKVQDRLLKSRRGKRAKGSIQKNCKEELLAPYLSKAKNWKGVIWKNFKEKEERIHNWGLFGDLFGIEDFDSTLWRKPFADALETIELSK